MIEYTIKKSTKARQLRITIHRDGGVIVTVPHRMSELAAARFVQEKKKWIEKKVGEMIARKAAPSALSMPKGSAEDLQKNKDVALALVQEKLNYFNRSYGFTWKNVTVKNLVSRWGSCSKIGHLNFSYKIIYLPKDLADYLIVHELCHLGEFNHSEKFWHLVGKAIPNYATLRQELRKLN